MASTIGTSDLEKSVKRGSASGFLMVKGIVAQSIGSKPTMTAVDKDAAPTFAIVVDSKGEKRAKRAPGDRANAEKTAMAAAMKHADGTVYLAQKVGSGEGGDVFKVLGSYKRS